MWNLQLDWYELILRAFVVFAFLFVFFRVIGKKHFSEMTPFDFIIFLFISEAVQSALVSDDKSIPAALISVSTLIMLNVLLNKLSYKFKKAEKLIEGAPRPLIENGQVNHQVLKEETITDRELHQALRLQGVIDIKEVKLATLETNGSISVIKKSDQLH